MKSFWIAIVAATVLTGGVLEARTMRVAVDKANFRAGPSTKHEVVYTAERFFAVEVLEQRKEKNDTWLKVRDFEGDVAWIAERLLDSKKAVVVSVPAAMIREKPDTRSAIVSRSERGEGLDVLRQEAEWIHVQTAGGLKGWVHADVVWGEK